MASIYKRGKWFWVSYWVGGQHHQKSFQTKNQRVARDRLKRLEYELSIGDLHAASRLPIRMVLQKFCEHMQVTRTFKSHTNDVSRLRIFFGPICDGLELGLPGGAAKTDSPKKPRDKYAHAHVKVSLLEDVSPETINRFITARIRENHWSPKTANSLRQVLHRFFAYATKHHGFRARDRRYPNPADGVERQREAAPEIRFLTLEQIEVQLRVPKPYPRLHAMVATYIYAGLRREEAIWLTHGDVNLTTRLIHVQAKTVEGQFWQPKTRRNRVVPMSSALLAILRSYKPPGDSIWFFPSPTGRRWNPDNFSQDLRAVNKASGLPWSCLDFRHTFGSHLAQRGESLYKIATLMGNSPEICRQHYAALVPETMHDAVEFSNQLKNSADGQTAQLLQEVLAELRGKKPEEGTRTLRIVADDAG